MKKRQFWFAALTLAAFSAFGQPAAQAAVLCTGTIASLTATPCATANFTISFAATTGGSGVSDNDLDVTVSSTGPTDLDVVIAPDSALNYTLTSGGVIAQYNFHYTLSFSPGYGMSSAEIDINNATVGAVAPGLVTGFKELNTTYQVSAGSLSSAGTTNLSNSINLPYLLAPVVIEDDNTLFGTGTVGHGVDAKGSVENVLTFGQVPEPFTTALCGAGLLAVGLLRRQSITSRRKS